MSKKADVIIQVNDGRVTEVWTKTGKAVVRILDEDAMKQDGFSDAQCQEIIRKYTATTKKCCHVLEETIPISLRLNQGTKRGKR